MGHFTEPVDMVPDPAANCYVYAAHDLSAEHGLLSLLPSTPDDRFFRRFDGLSYGKHPICRKVTKKNRPEEKKHVETDDSIEEVLYRRFS